MPKKRKTKVAPTFPDHISAAMLGGGSSIELKIAVSDKSGVKAYGFAFDGAPVPMTNGQGKFFAPSGVEKLLEWVMIGDPNGTMKVIVTQNGTTVDERDKSTIPDGKTKGYDAFEIEVS